MAGFRAQKEEPGVTTKNNRAGMCCNGRTSNMWLAGQNFLGGQA